MKKIAAIILSLCLATAMFAQVISVKKTDDGWRLMDGHKEIEVKGVVWAYTPIGETHTYDLWSKPDDYIMQMIDTDMPMLKAMGVNTIRTFSSMPPRWVEYIYEKYGIYYMVNDLLGRYGVSVNGTWYGTTDYSDQYTREALLEQARKTAETYRGVKGVLMYMVGNESNYGLVWEGSNIENLPVGEQDSVKAGYLYSLLEEAMAIIKDIDPLRPVGFINGDTQYLDIIAELCPSLDILGVNAYRGYKFYDSFFENIEEVLDKPIVFTEAGADAYNAINKQEDQYAQMVYLMSQWQEIFGQAYGKGRSGNIIGGYVFEWIDEWWKHYQNKDLDIHNTTGTWSNAGYDLDYRDGINNMDEEWFGLCALSPLTDNGINRRVPRAAYYMLQQVWTQLSLYKSTQEEIDAVFSKLDPAMFVARGNEVSIKEMLNENKKIGFSTLSATVQSTTPVYLNGLIDSFKAGAKNWSDTFRYKTPKGDINETTVTAETDIGVHVAPFENFNADVVVKVATGEPFTRIGDHYASYYENTGSLHGNNKTDEDHLKYVDLYSASFNYENKAFDLNGYYHVGHASFEGKGDPFAISKEAFDIIGYDTYGSKAPIALEFIGKGILSGLEVIGGPEIYGGAAPQIQANYVRWMPNIGPLDGIFLNATGAAEFAVSEHVLIDPYAGYGGGYKASLYAETYIMPWFQVKGGFLTAGSEKIGAKYINNDKKLAKVNFADTLGGYLQVGTDMFQHAYIYSNVIYRGIVADTNPAAVRGSFFTADSGSGNRFEVQLGADLTYGNFSLKPVIRARTPLQKPLGRSLLDGSPFIVGLGNRQALEFEAVFTYDPEGATWFHEWNSNDIEGAPIAASLTAFYQLFAGKTDNIPYKGDKEGTVTRNDGTSVTGFTWNNGGALDLQNHLFQVGARVVANPRFAPGLTLIGKAGVGRLGASTGSWQDTQEYCLFYTAGIAARYKHLIGSFDCTINGWGAESWWRDFNMTFPFQYTFDVAYAFNSEPSFLDYANRVGLRIKGKTFGENSSDAYGALPVGAALDGAMYFELSTYFSIGL